MEKENFFLNIFIKKRTIYFRIPAANKIQNAIKNLKIVLCVRILVKKMKNIFHCFLEKRT